MKKIKTPRSQVKAEGLGTGCHVRWGRELDPSLKDMLQLRAQQFRG